MSREIDPWISASDIGRAQYCPHYLEHKFNGESVSASAQKARIKGDLAHDELNIDAQDKRCYITSHLYGIDDPRTILLRNYRDNSLKNHFIGRLFITSYYSLSPYLVDASRRTPKLERLLRKLVTRVTHFIAKWQDDV